MELVAEVGEVSTNFLVQTNFTIVFSLRKPEKMRHTTPGPNPGQGVGTTVNNTYTYNSSTTCIYLVITQWLIQTRDTVTN
jgi:hypothetical protein